MSPQFENATPSSKTGKVFLVGAGPGSPDLLTLRAAKLLAQAEVVVYDHLVGSAILPLANPDAALICAGKKSGHHTLSQEQINSLLISLARQGKQVVRLKGGDPFIFGRGGEELCELAQAGIAFEVVPGVTSACGAAAFAGIPLTHRAFAQNCLFVTGHLKNASIDLDWPTLARADQTVVIYMGLGALPEISQKLIEAGADPHTPAACIHSATLPHQVTIVSDIVGLPNKVKEFGAPSPALLIIGQVVSLHEKLSWFENKQNFQFKTPDTAKSTTK